MKDAQQSLSLIEAGTSCLRTLPQIATTVPDEYPSCIPMSGMFNVRLSSPPMVAKTSNQVNRVCRSACKRVARFDIADIPLNADAHISIAGRKSGSCPWALMTDAPALNRSGCRTLSIALRSAVVSDILVTHSCPDSSRRLADMYSGNWAVCEAFVNI